MKWFVFYEYGSNQDGDKTCQLEEFDNKTDAVKKIEEIVSNTSICGWMKGWDDPPVLICGNRVEL